MGGCGSWAVGIGAVQLCGCPGPARAAGLGAVGLAKRRPCGPPAPLRRPGCVPSEMGALWSGHGAPHRTGLDSDGPRIPQGPERLFWRGGILRKRLSGQRCLTAGAPAAGPQQARGDRHGGVTFLTLGVRQPLPALPGVAPSPAWQSSSCSSRICSSSP